MSHFLMPVMALVLWTFVIWLSMYRRRIPAMNQMNPDAQEFIRDPSLIHQLGPRVRWAADNHNHLHEQPTLFYAVCLVLFVTAQVGAVNFYLAWAYVSLRVVHSLVQITTNRVLMRFSVFVLGSVVLAALAVRATLGLLTA